jgi:hypothetical protein
MRVILLLFALLSSALAQTSTSGKVSIQGTTQMSAKAPALFNVLTLTANSFAPSTTLLPGLPVAGAGHAEGYQGGANINGEAVLIPWQYGVTTPHGTVLGYFGGSGGTFHCTTSTSCAANWEYFDMSTLVGTQVLCPTTCQTGATAKDWVGNLPEDSQGNYYFVPALSAVPIGGAFVRYNGLGLTTAANYSGFLLPCQGTSAAGCAGTTVSTYLGRGYGWCTGVFDGRYIVYAPTAGGSTQNSNVVRFDTQGGGAYPSGNAPFVIQYFSHVDISAFDAHACCFLSSIYDGGRYTYFLPVAGNGSSNGDMARYDTACGTFTSSSCWSFLSMPHLGTSGYPQVSGSGNLARIQTGGYYVGGQMVWSANGQTLWLYMAPFANNPGDTAQSGQQLGSNIIRMQAGSCSPGTPGLQGCTGTFTASDIFSSSSTWQIYDLANLTTNKAWTNAGFVYPPLFPASSPLAGQLTIGGFQLTWLNVTTPSDPIVGFVTDFGNYFVRQHEEKPFSDPTSWDVGLRPSGQASGCMGGVYFPATQTYVVACPAASPTASAWQISSL